MRAFRIAADEAFGLQHVQNTAAQRRSRRRHRYSCCASGRCGYGSAYRRSDQKEHIVLVSLPARLHHARDLPEIAQLAQRDTAQLELAVIATRTARHLAAVADAASATNCAADRQASGCAAKRSSSGSVWSLIIALSSARLAAYCFAILRRFVLLDRARLCHLSILVSRPAYCRNGKLNALRSARASSSVLAVVHTMMSMPQIWSIWS